MAREQKRISVDTTLWTAIEAAAAAKGVPVQVYVEDALRVAVDHFDLLKNAAIAARSMQLSASEVSSQLQAISDFIVDAHRANAGVGRG
ncbi:hypothetical protein [Bosea beijingensis]|uniref:hypothetical protein n=1 Tax=Bosea beijingensis TaxID=3068632 RepID=UPI0027421A48|nr:hypothetical protein [Bosea sp. REN20]